MRFGGDHMGRALGMTRGSSARGQGRRFLLRRCATSQWAIGLDMAGGSLETDGTFVEVTIDVDMTEFPALETGFIVVGRVMREGSIMVAASPPDFSVSDGNFFFFGQG